MQLGQENPVVVGNRSMQQPFRIGVIGDTGRSGYGHGLDTAFQQLTGRLRFSPE
jgi:hypothetical protein